MSTTITIARTDERFANWRQILSAAVSGLRLPTAPSVDPRLGDAAAVRELAFSYRQSDPGFAEDLYAAADRHEWALEAQGSVTPP